MNLTPGTVLQRIPDLRVEIDSSNMLTILVEAGVVECGPRGLAILDAFYRPRPLAEALAVLQPQIAGAQDWINLTTTIVQLYRAGVLRDENQIEATLKADDYGYDTAGIHVAMLLDRTRTSSFLAGIREVVRPDDVVVDIGTGTGVFAIAAAQAGARHVYAVEASAIGRLAQGAFAANGLADRITLVQGWSTQISLPERADVLVSEMVGNDPMSDYVLEVVLDARRRLLAPEARLVPSTVSVLGLPLTIPPETLMRHTFTPQAADIWHAWYGIDFSPFVQAAGRSSHVFSIRPYEARDWPVLSAPIQLAAIDLNTVTQLMVDQTTIMTAEGPGFLNGVLIYFEVQLGPRTRLSLNPANVGRDSFRYSPVWVLEQPLAVKAGEQLAVAYRYRVPGCDDRITVRRV